MGEGSFWDEVKDNPPRARPGRLKQATLRLKKLLEANSLDNLRWWLQEPVERRYSVQAKYTKKMAHQCYLLEDIMFDIHFISISHTAFLKNPR